MTTSELVALKRDCEATQIPSGMRFTLPAGSQVMIMQSLGGTYTVVTEQGDMVRIAASDADALGKEAAAVAPAAAPAAAQGAVDEKLVWEQLKTIYDPEIPVNIVDLGLVYGCRISPLPAGGNRVDVAMTMTAPGCGMGDVLKSEAESKLLTVPGVTEANVEVVWEPPWNPSMMSADARLALGF
ncbi:MAG: putative Fe-S cluster assembly protein SufT [Chloroflexi bacterium]|nr:putative Fe-S cluster assembly protein SufT [Chloroflexota bacterium]